MFELIIHYDFGGKMLKKVLFSLALFVVIFTTGCLVETEEEPDTTLPIIAIIGKNPDTINVGDIYIDSGAVAADDIDGDISSLIIVQNGVDTSTPGAYKVTYTVSDIAGNLAQVSRDVLVLDEERPTISIIGSNPDTAYLGFTYYDSGATAIDLIDGNLTDSIKIVSTVDTSKLGSYSVTYTVSDASGNSDTVIKTVVIINKPSRPLYIFETDYTSGNIGLIDETVSYSSIQTIYSDGSVYSYEGEVFVLEAKGADNIVRMDEIGNVKYQKHLIDNCNPQDIKFISSEKAYISCLALNFLLIVNPQNGMIIDSISIDGFADTSATTPYASAMIQSGNSIFLVLQRLNGSFGAVNLNKILKINTITDEVIDTITSTYKNAGDMVEVNGMLYINSVGSWSDATDGAIEEFDPMTGTVRTVITEASLNFNFAGVYTYNNSLLANIQVYDDQWNLTVMLITIDPATGNVIDTLTEVTEPGPAIYDDEKNRLFIAERAFGAGGVHIYENGTYIKKIETDIAPNGFVFLTE